MSGALPLEGALAFTPSVAGGACGGAHKLLLVAPWWELFPIRVCLGFQEKLDGLGNSAPCIQISHGHIVGVTWVVKPQGKEDSTLSIPLPSGI